MGSEDIGCMQDHTISHITKAQACITSGTGPTTLLDGNGGGPSNFWRAYAGHSAESLNGGVWGNHWYWNAATSQTISIADSIATSCNLTEWGTEWGL